MKPRQKRGGGGARTFAACLVIALAGCAVLQPPFDQVDQVVRETVQAAKAPAAEQKAALAAAQQAFVAEASILNRLRLASLLASLPAPLRDDARAAELLEAVADPNGLATGRFAALLASLLSERQRVGRELDRVTKERAALEKERAQLQAAEKERDKREEALRQQLEALRAIERGILDREERLRRNPGAKP